VKDTLVVLGEPICAPEDFTAFLSEIKIYCEENAYSLLFLNATTMFLEQYAKMGLGCVKCGEEPRFYLPEYNIAGGKASKVRLNINHATKAGVIVKEYDPRNERNPELEKNIMEVSQEWFTMKKSSELVFTMGGIGFDNPMDRRYFYAVDAENNIEGFIVFVPFGGMNGYMADVTRHRVNATRGVMEKIFYEAMMTFKEEGIEWGSLAIAPLARLEEEPEVTAKLLNTIYEKMNDVYGFKTLYQTKLKYNPTYWEPNYYVYYPPIFSPAMAYAIIRIQNPLGIKDYIKSFICNRKQDNQNTQSSITELNGKE
jgi:phosphatidylglycerol lysyltransferase